VLPGPRPRLCGRLPGVFGDALQQLEQEIKLETNPGWSLPDLSGVLPGVKAVAIRDLALDATYYDTADLRLARHKVTLRFRRETEVPGPRRGRGKLRETEIWTLKLPSSSDSTALTRTEVSWAPEGPPLGADRQRAGTDRLASQRLGSQRLGSQRWADQRLGRQKRDRRSSAALSSGIGPSDLGDEGLRSAAGQPRSGPVHPEAARFLEAITLGHALEPVAHLSTTRRRTELRTSDGRRLAEIDQDSVIGADLLSRREVDVTHDAYADVRFSEVEVELAEGSSLEVLEAVVERLEQSGAFRSSRPSKLATVLALGRAGGADKGAPQPPDEEPPEGENRQDVAMSNVLARQARSCLETLLNHDPAIRLEDPDPEHVHRSRVATRRLRTVFRAYSSLVLARHKGATHADARQDEPVPHEVGPHEVGPEEAGQDDAGHGDPGQEGAGHQGDQTEAWFTALSQELKWLGHSLGTVRDSDVRLQSLEDDCANLPATDATGSGVLMARARDQQRTCHEELRETVSMERYLELLRALDALASGPGPGSDLVPARLWALLSEPAAIGVPSLAQRQWRALYKAVGHLGDEPDDEALHRVRIQAKRLRYLSEVAAPVLGSPARARAATRTAKAATALQDVLGEFHDAVVTEQWLRETASRKTPRARTATQVATGIAAGQLIAVARERQRQRKQAWPAAWEQLDRPGLRDWVKAS
jgi:CHAD domain-containing protein